MVGVYNHEILPNRRLIDVKCVWKAFTIQHLVLVITNVE